MSTVSDWAKVAREAPAGQADWRAPAIRSSPRWLDVSAGARKARASYAVAHSGRQPTHGLLARPVFFRHRLLPPPGIVVIPSENFDGEWIAGIIEPFGYGTAQRLDLARRVKALVRSSGHGRGKPAAFTLDARAGRRRCQARAIGLAKATGNPGVPFHIVRRASLDGESWDRTRFEAIFDSGHRNRRADRDRSRRGRSGIEAGGWSSNNDSGSWRHARCDARHAIAVR